MADVDYFLKIEGIEGESQDTKHKNEIDVLSWSWGESNVGSESFGGGGGSGKVHMEDFNFSMKTSKASPKLLKFCADGSHITKAVLTCRKAGKGQQEYLKITFNECLISGFHTGGSQGDIIPIDQISLNYDEINYEYFVQGADGTTTTTGPVGWNLKQNKAVP